MKKYIKPEVEVLEMFIETQTLSSSTPEPESMLFGNDMGDDELYD